MPKSKALRARFEHGGLCVFGKELFFAQLFANSKVKQHDCGRNEHAAENICKPVHAGNNAPNHNNRTERAAARAKRDAERNIFYTAGKLFNSGAGYAKRKHRMRGRKRGFKPCAEVNRAVAYNYVLKNKINEHCGNVAARKSIYIRVDLFKAFAGDKLV